MISVLLSILSLAGQPTQYSESWQAVSVIPDAGQANTAQGVFSDCNLNGIPDENEPAGTEDCNDNGVQDFCDIAAGTSADTDANTVPDECQQVLHVGTGPNDFALIQAAMDAANHGDTVLVADQVYTGDGNRDLRFHGKILLVKSANGSANCILNVLGVSAKTGPYHSGFIFEAGDTALAVVDGFTINGFSNNHTSLIEYDLNSSGTARHCTIQDNGGDSEPGVHVRGGTAYISDCVIRNNSARSWGGGVYVEEAGTVFISGCTIENNKAQNRYGGGVALLEDSKATILNTIIVGNSSDREFGGIYASRSELVIRNSVVARNRSPHYGSGITVGGGRPGQRVLTMDLCTIVDNVFTETSNGYTSGTGLAMGKGEAVITNSIFISDSPGPNISVNVGVVRIDYCNIVGGQSSIYGTTIWRDPGIVEWGVGNISTVPRFADQANGDYHLTKFSPGLDAGDPAFVPFGGVVDLDGEPRPLRGTVDIGADEFAEDCNENSVNDATDIANGTSQDCNANGIPDECEHDCNESGQPDDCDITNATAADCNQNSIPDECELAVSDCNGTGVPDDCDIAFGTSTDCTGNGIPDECEPDCNSNTSADSCDIAGGVSLDCNLNAIPDACDVASEDCNSNGIPDSCDLAAATSEDCDANGIPDECEAAEDCNENAIQDFCDVAAGTSKDCNTNGIPDECDLASGSSDDIDGDGNPDECCFLHSPDEFGCNNIEAIYFNGYSYSTFLINQPPRWVVRIRLDSTIVERLVVARSGVAVDPIHNKLYWSHRGNFPGTGTSRGELDGRQKTLISTSLSGKLVLDLGAGHIYWPAEGGARRTNLDGGDEISINLSEDVYYIALDPLGDKIYWTEFDNWAIRRANLDGTQIETIIATPNPRGIALDLCAQKFYWISQSTQSLTGGAVHRADFDGSNVETLAEVKPTFVPWAIQLDVPGGKMYWTESISVSNSKTEPDHSDGAIMRADLDGANVEKLPVRLYTNFPGAEFQSLALLLSDRSDCNANAIHDDCEVQRGFRTALPDFPKNRYLTLETSELQPDQVIRLTFTNLAPPFDVHNGKTMWVDQPFSVSGNSGSVSPVPDFPNFEAATLRCDPLPLDWSGFSTVDVFHELIVPGSLFTVDVFDAADLPGAKAVRSWTLTTAIWGDHAGPFDIERGQWILPDGRVDITTDAVAALDVFRNQPCTMHKTRADVYPATVDGVIDIVDISSVIDAFRGEDYPFGPPTWSCP